MPKKNKEIATTTDLRKVLLDTIQGIRSGDVEPRQGATIASLSKAVLSSAKLDFEVQKFYDQIETDTPKRPIAIELAK